MLSRPAGADDGRPHRAYSQARHLIFKYVTSPIFISKVTTTMHAFM